jgi:y4mF family transcriptional regulator
MAAGYSAAAAAPLDKTPLSAVSGLVSRSREMGMQRTSPASAPRDAANFIPIGIKLARRAASERATWSFSPDRDIFLIMAARSRPGRRAERAPSPDRETPVWATFVRERRKARGLTQRELAELAGVGPRAVWDLEQGKHTLRTDTVTAILRVFGKTLAIADAPREAAGSEDRP